METRLETLEEYCEIIADCPHSTPKWTSSGVLVIRNENIKNGRLDLSSPSFTDHEHYRERIRRAEPKHGDLVFTREAPMGEVCAIPPELPCCLGQRQVLLRPDAENSSAYLLYAFQSPYVQKQIRGHGTTGSTVSNLCIGDLKKLLIPRIGNETRIAKLLSTLDAKIDLNRRLNAELEAMAKLLYDYWFVQFDFPISAAQAAAMGRPDLEGKPYRASGGKMAYNAELKREIPEGWEVGTLLDIATFTNGIACQKYPPVDAQRLPVIKIKEMRDGFTADSEFVTDQVPKKVKVENGDILFSWSASLEVMIWSGGSGALNQHIFKVTSSSHPRSYVYFVLLDYLQHFRMLADLRKTTMGHITREHLEQSRIAIAPKEISNAFERVVNPLIERILCSQDETHELTQLRDWLLPMLMNGQVTVAEAASA
jgi:type I restriction enzyme, S subunit